MLKIVALVCISYWNIPVYRKRYYFDFSCKNDQSSDLFSTNATRVCNKCGWFIAFKLFRSFKSFQRRHIIPLRAMKNGRWLAMAKSMSRGPIGPRILIARRAASYANKEWREERTGQRAREKIANVLYGEACTTEPPEVPQSPVARAPPFPVPGLLSRVV